MLQPLTVADFVFRYRRMSSSAGVKSAMANSIRCEAIAA